MTDEEKEALRRLPLRDVLNLFCVSGPLEPNMPRIDMSDCSVRELASELIGPFVDSAIAELTRRANAERMTVADFIYADVEARSLFRWQR